MAAGPAMQKACLIIVELFNHGGVLGFEDLINIGIGLVDTFLTLPHKIGPA